MAIVYVLNQNKEPLMPTTRCGHIRWLLKNEKAKIVSTNPFIVQLMYNTENKTQDIILGIDPGRTNIGICAITRTGSSLLAVNVETRNKEIPKLMADRKIHRKKHRLGGRRNRRQRRAKANNTTVKNQQILRILPQTEKPIICHYIKNKESRFCNRKKPQGWLTPTANQLLQTHLNVINKICKILPVSKVCLEINKFAFMKLSDSTVQGAAFQNGPLKGYDGVKDAVNALQNGKCLLCDEPIAHYHHIVPKHKNGSETIDNRCGLCEYHHYKVHTDVNYEQILRQKILGIKKRYDALGVLNQIIPRLVSYLQCKYLHNVSFTTGKITCDFRKIHNINKDHFLDAYCIACVTLERPKIQIPKELWTIKQYRRHDRRVCQQEMVDRKYYLNNQLVATNRHKRIEQHTPSLEEYRIQGGLIDKLVVPPHNPTYQRMDRVFRGSMLIVNGQLKILERSSGFHFNSPDYYYFTDGTRARPKKTSVLLQNSGLVFVSKRLIK